MSLPIRRRRWRGDRCSRSTPAKRKASALHAARPGDQAHHRQHGDALAGAGFADDADDGTGVEGEVEAIDGAEHAARGGELDDQVADFEQRHQRFSFGSSASRRPSPNRLKASTVSRMARPGTPAPTRRADRTAARRPAWCPIPGVGGCAPRPRKPSAAASRMAVAKPERRLHDQRRQAVRQHGVEHQAQRAGAGAARRGDVVARQFRQCRGAGQARVAGQRDDGDRDHGVEQPGTQDGHDDDGEQQAGEHQHDVHQPHDRRCRRRRRRTPRSGQARCRSSATA